jgi:hypothetical protein
MIALTLTKKGSKCEGCQCRLPFATAMRFAYEFVVNATYAEHFMTLKECLATGRVMVASSHLVPVLWQYNGTSSLEVAGVT